MSYFNSILSELVLTAFAVADTSDKVNTFFPKKHSLQGRLSLLFLENMCCGVCRALHDKFGNAKNGAVVKQACFLARASRKTSLPHRKANNAKVCGAELLGNQKSPARYPGRFTGLHKYKEKQDGPEDLKASLPPLSLGTKNGISPRTPVVQLALALLLVVLSQALEGLLVVQHVGGSHRALGPLLQLHLPLVGVLQLRICALCPPSHRCPCLCTQPIAHIRYRQQH